jgi:N-acetylmuramoyl-L-alanine amidase
MRNAMRPTFVAALLSLASACGQPDGEPASRAPVAASVARMEVRARAALSALQRRQAPRDLDVIVQDLALWGRDPRNPQGADTLRLAGDLVAGRWRLTGVADDLRRARDYYHAAAIDPSKPGACAALRAHRDLLAELGDPDGAALGVRFEATCVPPPLRPRRVATTPSGPRSVARVRRVVLDPGHGGSDPGAVGPTGLTEASVTLDVAHRVAERLASRYGIQVVLTRDDDTYVDLETRTAHANDTRSDLFVSIHCNAAPNRDAHGVATFVLDTGSDRVAARVGRREGELVADDPVSSWHVTRILTSFRLSALGQQSYGLAEAIQRAMLHDLRLLYPAVDDLGVHTASFHVLVTARMPSVLVEVSFISNPMEEQRLRSEGYRDVLAGAIARAIASHGT